MASRDIYPLSFKCASGSLIYVKGDYGILKIRRKELLGSDMQLAAFHRSVAYVNDMPFFQDIDFSEQLSYLPTISWNCSLKRSATVIEGIKVSYIATIAWYDRKPTLGTVQYYKRRPIFSGHYYGAWGSSNNNYSDHHQETVSNHISSNFSAFKATLSPMECGVCNQVCDGVSKSLCTLICSHQLCYHCLEEFITKDNRCPFCNEKFAANSAKEMKSPVLENSPEYISFQTTSSVQSPQVKSALQQNEKRTTKEDGSKLNKEVSNNLQGLRNQTVEMLDTINDKISTMKELQNRFSQQKTDPKETVPPEIQDNIQRMETNMETPKVVVPKVDEVQHEIDKQGENLPSLNRKLFSSENIDFLGEEEETRECLWKEEGISQRKTMKSWGLAKEMRRRMKMIDKTWPVVCKEDVEKDEIEFVDVGDDQNNLNNGVSTKSTVKSPQGKNALQQNEKNMTQDNASILSKEVSNDPQGLRNQTVEMLDTIDNEISTMKELQNSFSQQSSDPKETLPPEIQDNIQRMETNMETPKVVVPKVDEVQHEIDKQGENLPSLNRKLFSSENIDFLGEEKETRECLWKEEGISQRKTKKSRGLAKEKRRRRKKIDKTRPLVCKEEVEKDEIEFLDVGDDQNNLNGVSEESGVTKRKRRRKKIDKTGTVICKVEVEEDEIHHLEVGDDRNNHSDGVSVMALWEMRKPMKHLVQQQRLFAVYLQEGGQRKSAKITLDNQRLYLHSLKDETKPLPNVYYLQYEEVLRLSVPLRSVFLDVCARGSAVGRIHILLNRTAPPSLALHCMGSKGPSYINTKTQILDQGTLLEQMLCGGPPTVCEGPPTGTGLSSDTNLDKLFSLRYDPSPRWDGKCGSVVLLDAQTSPPLLAIRTGPFEIGYDYTFKERREKKIGEVSDGLNVVRDAIYCLQDVKELTISNCGVVLSTELPIDKSSPL